MITSRPVAVIETTHSALIQWWWKDQYLHDSAYRERVEDAMQKTLSEVCKIFGVTEDTGLCCQWEGLRIYGDDLEKIKAAGDMLVKTLGRFKHVDFIGW